jgi:hypothetical protein
VFGGPADGGIDELGCGVEMFGGGGGGVLD